MLLLRPDSLPLLKVIIEWFSVDCHKTKTKLITLTNHSGLPKAIWLANQNFSMWLTQSVGKHVRTTYDLFWFHFCLDEKVQFFLHQL